MPNIQLFVIFNAVTHLKPSILLEELSHAGLLTLTVVRLSGTSNFVRQTSENLNKPVQSTGQFHQAEDS